MKEQFSGASTKESRATYGRFLEKNALSIWYVSNVSIIIDSPCLFLHHLPNVSLHFMALLCIFQN
jgi:hypothetical protein